LAIWSQDRRIHECANDLFLIILFGELRLA
jgi:hypothetical protein